MDTAVAMEMGMEGIKRCVYPWKGGVPVRSKCMRRGNLTLSWRRYFANTSGITWPPEVRDYNKKFTKTLEMIKKRQDVQNSVPVNQAAMANAQGEVVAFDAKNVYLDMQAKGL